MCEGNRIDKKKNRDILYLFLKNFNLLHNKMDKHAGRLTTSSFEAWYRWMAEIRLRADPHNLKFTESQHESATRFCENVRCSAGGGRGEAKGSDRGEAKAVKFRWILQHALNLRQALTGQESVDSELYADRYSIL